VPVTVNSRNYVQYLDLLHTAEKGDCGSSRACILDEVEMCVYPIAYTFADFSCAKVLHELGGALGFSLGNLTSDRR
jgi:hypothetical protein